MGIDERRDKKGMGMTSGMGMKEGEEGKGNRRDKRGLGMEEGRNGNERSGKKGRNRNEIRDERIARGTTEIQRRGEGRKQVSDLCNEARSNRLTPCCAG